MFFVYLLRSKKDNDLYLGCTNDLRKRFKEHNLGKVDSTKTRRPFKLIYYEAYLLKQDAFEREHNLKLRAKALQQLKRRIELCLKA
ncbi:MAG: hypothetical protein A2175_01895 [Candidatus Nealsonbacteria bacterium RBG_13_42_11]|uniref:GIY-YIG domain-containing protein n=1 Tax=Candidatus Nealsonbacteria bacterium RBG_13_42_11 TaxID=1801663 RepID=A0A1G2DY58_9BACT|nr:MAG: hypothetical protein A2175_01895 [Candidatus Nealsonbacteria bacterium RBG_13_42_11]HJX32014.1 GIY-YIG nuclease family protein [Thermodesulfobacteriota bacterium]